MDQFLIIGINNFLGFHLAKYLLDQGFEVEGYVLPIDNDYFSLKKMEFGRNANMTFINNIQLDSNKKIIVDLYGINNIEDTVSSLTEKINLRQTIALIDTEGLGVFGTELKLPMIFGEWDYINDEIKDNKGLIHISTFCRKFEEQMSDTNFNKLIIKEETTHESLIIARNVWFNKYKKSK